MAVERPMMGQGPAKVASAEDEARQEVGFTNPNLHRIVDPQDPQDELEVRPRDYILSIQGYDSYRTTEVFYHDEESTTSEIP